MRNPILFLTISTWMLAISTGWTENLTSQEYEAEIHQDGSIKYKKKGFNLEQSSTQWGPYTAVYEAVKEIAEIDNSDPEGGKIGGISTAILLDSIRGKGGSPRIYRLKSKNASTEFADVLETYALTPTDEKETSIMSYFGSDIEAKPITAAELPIAVPGYYRFKSTDGPTDLILLAGPSSLMKDSLPKSKDEVIRMLGDELLTEAIMMACNAKIRPREITAEASISAGFNFLVGSEGTISFSATWSTDILCE